MGKAKKCSLDSLKPPKKSIKRQAYQAYIDVFGERVLPIIKARYREALEKVPEGTQKPEWVAFMSEHAKAMLAQEPVEVRDEVEQKRRKPSQADGLDMFNDPTPDVTQEDLHKRALDIQS